MRCSIILRWNFEPLLACFFLQSLDTFARKNVAIHHLNRCFVSWRSLDLVIDHLFIIDNSFAETRCSLDRVHLEHHRVSPSLRSEIAGNKHTVSLSGDRLKHTHLAQSFRLWGSSEHCAVPLMDFVVRIPSSAVLGQDLVNAVLDDLLLDLDVIDERRGARIEGRLIGGGHFLVWEDWPPVILDFLFDHVKLVLRIDQNTMPLDDRHALDKNDTLPLDLVLHKLLHGIGSTLDARTLLILSNWIRIVVSHWLFGHFSSQLLNLLRTNTNHVDIN